MKGICQIAVFSPRPWGCFYGLLAIGVFIAVFPTPVGVFLDYRQQKQTILGFPHARGGVSLAAFTRFGLHLFSPRPWGCFQWYPFFGLQLRVFPTPVGVFLKKRTAKKPARCFPHARGGVSQPGSFRNLLKQFSPRPWGCFSASTGASQCGRVFPTPVGVFLLVDVCVSNAERFPHARGGVSTSPAAPFTDL